MHTKQSKAEVQENTVENVEDSDSDLTDLEDLDEEANLEQIGTEGSISLQIETESDRTRVVGERSYQLSKEKKYKSVGVSSGNTGKTAWQASVDHAIQEEHSSTVYTNRSVTETTNQGKPS